MLPVSTHETEEGEPEPPVNLYDPLSFDSWIVNAVAPPLVIGLAIVIERSFFGMLFEGFHVWMHELGHATVAWLTGRRALPLPIGWTSVNPEKSLFVYFGVLFLLGLMLVAGARERKIWPMLLTVVIALTQAYMTWWLPDRRVEMWLAFGGVGGEFYLAAAMMALFYVQLPEKFKWGGCRYVFLFICASSFFDTYAFWKKVKRGEEGIPYGTMINGEEDGGGDMNVLHDVFGWTQREIIHTYNNLGDVCVITLIVAYLIFALRLDRIAGRTLLQVSERIGGALGNTVGSR
ncbi:MAG: M50 family metallopeptidase [Gloeobacteraceae cyanobacterium ES-bin-144]|nr:M50 family metallopeptidase [Verrucomicrobiales bacterium]